MLMMLVSMLSFLVSHAIERIESCDEIERIQRSDPDKEVVLVRRVVVRCAVQAPVHPLTRVHANQS